MADVKIDDSRFKIIKTVEKVHDISNLLAEKVRLIKRLNEIRDLIDRAAALGVKDAIGINPIAEPLPDPKFEPVVNR